MRFRLPERGLGQIQRLQFEFQRRHRSLTRVVYVNGRYRAYAQASVHVEDRGFQFADAVYEVCEVRDGALVERDRHLARLLRSLGELQIARPMTMEALHHVLRETVRRNRVRDGFIYLQVSRGAGERDFAFPPADVRPTVVCFARSLPRGEAESRAERGIAVVTLPDIRWGRRDIKTVMLLPAVLAKREAAQQGAKEAWLVNEAGFVTEGASSNAWIVTDEGRLITPGLSTSILPGVTRATLIDAIAHMGLEFEERYFTPAEAATAREAFVTSATNTVMPVISINGVAIGDGRPGSITKQLRKIFHTAVAIAE